MKFFEISKIFIFSWNYRTRAIYFYIIFELVGSFILFIVWCKPSDNSISHKAFGNNSHNTIYILSTVRNQLSWNRFWNSPNSWKVKGVLLPLVMEDRGFRDNGLSQYPKAHSRTHHVDFSVAWCEISGCSTKMFVNV